MSIYLTKCFTLFFEESAKKKKSLKNCNSIVTFAIAAVVVVESLMCRKYNLIMCAFQEVINAKFHSTTNDDVCVCQQKKKIMVLKNKTPKGEGGMPKHKI